MPQEDLISKLITSVTGWHRNNIAAIDEILTYPEAKVQLGSDSSESPIVLEGDKLIGFRIGLRVCKEWFETLPFNAVPTSGPTRELAEGEEMPEPEMLHVYVFTSDNGDGSASVQYTLDEDLLERLQEEDESYNMNEGYSDILTFPAGFDFEAAGFSFYQE